MSVFKKLQQVRVDLHAKELKKTGNNNGRPFFELSDFLPTALVLMNKSGLCDTVKFTSEVATLTVTDTDDGSSVDFTMPMGTADLKGCHNIQNIGASVTYARRYLLMNALNIMEHDGLDALLMGEFDIVPWLEMIEKSKSIDELNAASAAAKNAIEGQRDHSGLTRTLAACKNKRGKELQAVAPISSEDFPKAIAAIKAGSYTVEQIKARALTPEQLKEVEALQ